METALVSMLCSPKVCSGVCMFEFSVKITCLRWNLSGIWGSQVLRLGGTTLPCKLGPGSGYKRGEMGIYKGYNSTYNWQGPFVGILKLPMFHGNLVLYHQIGNLQMFVLFETLFVFNPTGAQWTDLRIVSFMRGSQIRNPYINPVP